MGRKRHCDTPEWIWEQALIDAYYEHRWCEALTPLADALHRWEAGEGDPEDVARAAARLRKPVETLDWIFTQKRDYLVRMIEFDQDWSGPWIAAHPRPLATAADSANSEDGPKAE